MVGKPKVYTGTIASGDKFIANPAETARLSELIDNLRCVEMESAAAAQVCFENDVPILVVRVVSDKADHSAIIDFNKFVDEIAGHMLMGFVAEYFSFKL
jgi:adenosylhomocysteine nucleosidase